jgi:hypothetical protein
MNKVRLHKIKAWAFLRALQFLLNFFLKIQALLITILALMALCCVMGVPQNYFNTNAYIAAQQRGQGQYNSYGQRPSVDPSAYYTGANRAKIARMLANYY